MIETRTAVMILLFHFAADFILQSDWMAKGKSKAMGPLLVHVAVYTAILSGLGIRWAVVNGAAHLCVDFVTSRAARRLWNQDRVHEFFVVVGADQFIHAATLLLTWGALKP